MKSTVTRVFLGAERPEMGCEPLDVEQHSPDPLQFPDQSDEGDLRRIRLSVEHGFASEESVDVDAVETADKFTGFDVPGLDAVGPSESMEFGICHVNLISDPAAVSIWAGALAHDLFERGIYSHLVAAQRPSQ